MTTHRAAQVTWVGVLAVVWAAGPVAADSRAEILARRHQAAAGAGGQSISEATRAAIARRHGLVLAPRLETAGERSPSSAEVWRALLDGNRRFVLGKPAGRDLLSRRRLLADGQHPQAAVLGCSDSRVSPELVFDQGLGDLFVVRTAGNVVDTVALASLEYAVEHLHVKTLVVLGHGKCGAVAAAASDEKLPSAPLDSLVRRIEPALTPFRSTASGDALVGLGVDANVRRSADEILSSSPLVAAAVAAGRLSMVKAVYRIDTGEVVMLP